MADEREKRRMDGAFYEQIPGLIAGLEASGLNRTEIASRVGLSTPQISRLVSGDALSMRLDDGLRLCELAGIDPWQLAFGRPRLLPVERGGGVQPAYETELRSRTEIGFQFLAQMERLQKQVDDLKMVVDALHPQAEREAARKALRKPAKTQRKGRRSA